MKESISIPLKWVRSALSWTINLLFYGSVFWIIAISELPAIAEPVFFMRKQFLSGNENLFRMQDPGISFAIFEPYLSHKKCVTFLADTPYNSENKAIEQLHAAQSRLAPILLNPNPIESTALVFCSQNKIAAARMNAAGYQAIKVLGDGKLIAEKRS